MLTPAACYSCIAQPATAVLLMVTTATMVLYVVVGVASQLLQINLVAIGLPQLLP